MIKLIQSTILNIKNYFITFSLEIKNLIIKITKNYFIEQKKENNISSIFLKNNMKKNNHIKN